MKSHPLRVVFYLATGMEARTLVAGVNEAPVALQSRDLSEAAAECSSLTAPANKGTSFVYQGKRGYLQHFGQKNDRL